LPLDDRILERFLVPKPRPITGRSEFVYYQGARLPSDATPDVKNVSYSITAEVDRSRPDDDGVIVACGDRFSGYALFVKDGRLVHDYNCAGTHYVVTSSVDVPTGSSTLRYEFHKTGTLSGDAALFVDGERVAEAYIPQTLGTHVAATGLCVGRDPLAPVSDAYERPFPFRGTIRRVVVHVGDDRDPVGPTDVID